MASIVDTARWYIAITRPINIVIVASTQFLIYYLLLFPIYERHGIDTLFNWSDVLSLIAVSCMCLAVGNIYNDIKDRKADLVNKPHKTYIKKGRLALQQAKAFMYTLSILALGIVAGKAIQHDIIQFVPYFILVLSVLYIYSAFLKRSPLLGNIIVAFLSALVAGIVLWVEYPRIMALEHPAKVHVMSIFYAYLSFSFLISLYREIVKDLQDRDGDLLIDAHTLPISIGIQSTKIVTTIVGIALLSSYALWFRIPVDNTVLFRVIFTMALILPTLYTLWKLWGGVSSEDYGRISTYIKYIMAMALLIFILILAS